MNHKSQLTSIKELVDELDQITNEDDYKKLVTRLNIDIKEYKPYAHWSDEQYTRNCIRRTDDYELILLCWNEGQETPIHCHNNQECWVYVVQGEFDEQRYNKESDEEIEVEMEMQLEEEGISYMNDDMGYHSLANINNGRSMSLHLYMNPIDECNIYNEETGEFELKKLVYYSYEGKVLQEA